jgi:hypothetical protein
MRQGFRHLLDIARFAHSPDQIDGDRNAQGWWLLMNIDRLHVHDNLQRESTSYFDGMPSNRRTY